MYQDYNVKYAASLKEPRVLPIRYTDVLAGIVSKILGYYKGKPDFFSQYAVLEEDVKSRKKADDLRRMHHLMHAHEFTKKNWMKKIKRNNDSIDSLLAKYKNNLSSKRFNSFETGVSIGDYMRDVGLQEISAGCTAGYVHSDGLIIPSMFVEARTLGNRRREANKLCRAIIEHIKREMDIKHVVVYENAEKG